MRACGMTKQLLGACNSTSCQVASISYTVGLQLAVAKYVTANAHEHFQMSAGTGNRLEIGLSNLSMSGTGILCMYMCCLCDSTLNQMYHQTGLGPQTKGVEKYIDVYIICLKVSHTQQSPSVSTVHMFADTDVLHTL